MKMAIQPSIQRPTFWRRSRRYIQVKSVTRMLITENTTTCSNSGDIQSSFLDHLESCGSRLPCGGHYGQENRATRIQSARWAILQVIDERKRKTPKYFSH